MIASSRPRPLLGVLAGLACAAAVFASDARLEAAATPVASAKPEATTAAASPGAIPGAASLRPGSSAPEPTLRLHAFTLEHQSAAEALPVVRPLLSARGTVELQAGSNTLVIRDTLASLSRVVAAIHAYDHPTREVAFEIQIVRANRTPLSPPPPSTVSPAILDRLRELLRFETFWVVARAELRPHEGEEVAYDLPEGFRVSFRMGTVISGKRVRLAAFRIAERRKTGEHELIQANLNPFLDQPLILGLSHDESSASALMVVLSPLESGPKR